MTESAPTLAKLLDDAVEAALLSVHTALICSVISYDATRQAVTVQPVMRQAYLDEDENRVAEKMPAIQNVPVMFPGSGSFSMTWPISKGDFVLVVFSETSTDRFMSTGSTDVDPGDDHHHHIADAIAIPGIRPFVKPVPSSGTDGTAMVVSAPAIKLGDSSASSPVALKSDLDNLKNWIDTHVHTSASSGSPTSPPTTSSPSATGSTKVKAK